MVSDGLLLVYVKNLSPSKRYNELWGNVLGWSTKDGGEQGKASLQAILGNKWDIDQQWE